MAARRLPLPESLPKAVARPEVVGIDKRIAAKVEQMRARDASRRSRFFDAKVRTIGVDKNFLDSQVAEKVARLQCEREREKALERDVMRAHEELAKREMEVHNSRRATQAELRAFLAKQVAERQARDAAEKSVCSITKYGPSSVQVMEGEDELKKAREMEQKKQQRDALEQQMFEKIRRKNKVSERNAAVPALPYGDLAGPKEEIAARARRLAKETFEVNRRLAEDAAHRHFAARDAEESLARAELEHMKSDKRIINEPPTEKQDGGRRYRKDAYRGAPDDADRKVNAVRDQQVKASRMNSELERSEEALEDMVREKERRAAVKEMAKRYREKTSILRGIAVENGHTAARRREEPPLVAKCGDVHDEFFDQFGIHAYMLGPRERSRSRDGMVLRCDNCGGRGHIAAQCPSPIMQDEVEVRQAASAPLRRPSRTEAARPAFQGKCANCFKYGHRARECPNDTTCTKCYQSGHNSKECPVNQETCGRCRRVGHSTETCPNPIRCDKCGENGHPAVWCGVKCHNCGETGHMIKQCPKPPVCRICRQTGHKSEECQMRHGRYEIRTDTAEVPSRSGWHSEIQCLQCLQYGHIARDCPNPRVCHRCGGPGHESRSCQNPLGSRFNVGQSAVGRTLVSAEVPFGAQAQGNGAAVGNHYTEGVQCLQCLQYGHIARHCPNPRACHRCGRPGHESRMCPQGEQHHQDRTVGGSEWSCDSSVQCLQCLGFGHMARSCPNKRVCHRCGQPGHESKRCHLGPGPMLVAQSVSSTRPRN